MAHAVLPTGTSARFRVATHHQFAQRSPRHSRRLPPLLLRMVPVRLARRRFTYHRQHPVPTHPTLCLSTAATSAIHATTATDFFFSYVALCLIGPRLAFRINVVIAKRACC